MKNMTNTLIIAIIALLTVESANASTLNSDGAITIETAVNDTLLFEESAPAQMVPEGQVLVKAGTAIPIKLKTTMDSGSIQTGAKFSGYVSIDVILDSGDIIPEGAKVQGEILASVKGGRLKGVPSITINLTHLQYNGKYVVLNAVPIQIAGESNAKKTVLKTGVGAGVGAALNGGSGAGKGAAIMGGMHLLSNKGTLRVPAGSEINFTTAADLVL